MSKSTFTPPPLKPAGAEYFSENKGFISFQNTFLKKMKEDYLALEKEIAIANEKSEEKQNEIEPSDKKKQAFENFMGMFTKAKSEPLKRKDSGPKMFDQKKILEKLDETNPEHKELIKLERKFGGLCEIISNYVIANDLLGKKEDSQVDVKKFIFSKTPNNLQMSINLEGLSEDKIKNSHIVERSNIFVKLGSILFDINPHSIIHHSKVKDILLKVKSTSEKQINQELLGEALDNASLDDYIKFQVFRQKGLNFSGHSMVIKKTGNGVYSFFNPDEGEHQNLNLKDLCEKLNASIVKCKGDRVALIDGKKYLADLNIQPEPTVKNKF